MEQWYIYKKKADFAGIVEKYQIDPVIARLIRNRDVISDEEIHSYLYGTMKDVSDPLLLKGAKETAEILEKKIREEKKIRIISDYDVDGVMSNYILWKALTDLGGIVDFTIPNRMKDGYGINQSLVSRAVKDGIDTIITCDNGISAGEAVKYGR